MLADSKFEDRRTFRTSCIHIRRSSRGTHQECSRIQFNPANIAKGGHAAVHTRLMNQQNIKTPVLICMLWGFRGSMIRRSHDQHDFKQDLTFATAASIHPCAQQSQALNCDAARPTLDAITRPLNQVPSGSPKKTKTSRQKDHFRKRCSLTVSYLAMCCLKANFNSRPRAWYMHSTASRNQTGNQCLQHTARPGCTEPGMCKRCSRHSTRL